jgi:chromosomal replication initiator protein
MKSFLDGDDRMLLGLKSSTKACCEVFNIDEKDLLGKKRSSEFIVPRHLMYYIATQKIGLSYTQTGRYFKKDHTSIMHGTKVAEVRLSEDKGLSQELKEGT